MTDFDKTDKDLLSSFLDQELEQETAHRAEQLVQHQFESNVQYRNFSTVKKACAEMAEVSSADESADSEDFLSGIFAQIEQIEQDNPAEDLECLSAWVDGELTLEEAELAAAPYARSYADQTQMMGIALKALPVPEYSVDFAEQVMARVDIAAGTSEVDGFAEVAQALRELPVPDFSADFVARVMLATEAQNSGQKAKLFALPTLWQHKWGQMVAAVAVFGLLVLVSQNMLQSSQPTVASQIPSDRIVQVEYAPEAELFEDVMNTSLEDTSSDDITLLIGG